MLIYNKLTESFSYFIHIPRTGGRFVESIFKNDNNYYVFFEDYRNFYKNKELPHLTYPHYLELDKFFLDYLDLDQLFPSYDHIPKLTIKDINHFTIVRNPFNKFKSELKAYVKCEKDLFDISELTKNELKMMIDPKINNIRNNWFVSQSSFISPQTKIWKFENRFDWQFINWTKEHLNFDFDTKNLNVKYKKEPYDDNKLDFRILEKIKPLIEEIYEKDYDMFGYQKDI